jgi:hypothetical protein
MGEQSESRGDAKQEMERGKAQSSRMQMKVGQPQRGRGGPVPGRPDDVRDQSRGSGILGTEQHTDAGSTGTSGGQISPQPGMAERIGKSNSGKKG